MKKTGKMRQFGKIVWLCVMAVLVFSQVTCYAEETEIVFEEEEENPTISEEPEQTIEVKEVEIGNYEKELKVDAVMNLTVTVLPSDATDATVTYRSSNPGIATVNSTGEVKGIAPGDAVIYVSAGSITREAPVRVKIATTAIQLNSDFRVMKPKETFQIKAVVQPVGAESGITYKSTNDNVATVSASGLVTAKSCGNAAIIVANGEAHVSVSVMVNENGVVQDSVEQAEENSEKPDAFPEEVSVHQYAVISKAMLKNLYETKNVLTIRGEGYTIYLDGKDIVNYENELKTELWFQNEETGVSFVVNGGNRLCGKITIDLSDKVTDEKYLYLYNEQKDKYQRIAAGDMSELTIDTAGTYLLTAKPLTGWKVNVILVVAAVVVILIGVGVYIGVKKQYWFW